MKTADLSLITEESVSHNTDIFKKVMLRNGDVPNITCFSQARLIPGQTVTPHAHDDMHEIFFTQQGSGVITVDGHDYPLKPGVCVAASPGETHAIKNNGESDLLLVYFGVTEKQAISAEFWIKTLDLKPHPEGGFYRETYRSEEFVGETSLPSGFRGNRNLCSAIYYLLKGNDFSAFHRIKSDELWHFHSGTPIMIHILSPGGSYRSELIGNSGKDQKPRAVIPAGSWFAAEISGSGSYSLAGCTVSPGFDFNDFEIGKRDVLCESFPKHSELITRLTRQT